MRSEKEMMDLIMAFAKTEVRIRSVIMNGSRTNPNVKKDKYQDFDIVYLVTEPDDFTKNLDWIQSFGEKLVWQLPSEPRFYKQDREGSYGILMQFTDGNRIDLTIDSVGNYKAYCMEDRLSVVLLDKDGVLPELPAPDESSHYLTEPSKDAFDACRCEFWWVSTYVAKGLKRHQVLYAEHHMEVCVRYELQKMLGWYAGSQHGFDRSIGKCGDRLAELLPAEIWDRYLATYSVLKEEDMWNALKNAADLFTEISRKVADHYGYIFEDLTGKPDHWDADVPVFLFNRE